MATLRKENADGSCDFRDHLANKTVGRMGGSYRTPIVAVLPIAGGVDTAGGIASWMNPENLPIIVLSATLDVTTPSTAAATVSVGESATGATAATNLFNAQTIASAEDIATSTQAVRVPVGGYITASTASGASAGMAGNLIIEYIVP